MRMGVNAKKEGNPSRISEEEFNSNIHVREFKRTCNGCGKVWHSLESREIALKKKSKSSNFNEMIGGCLMCGGSPFGALLNSQASNTTGGFESELVRLRRCPECGSQNYGEEIVIYEKR